MASAVVVLTSLCVNMDMLYHLLVGVGVEVTSDLKNRFNKHVCMPYEEVTVVFNVIVLHYLHNTGV